MSETRSRHSSLGCDALEGVAVDAALVAASTGEPRSFPANVGIHELFEAHAVRTPGAIAIEDRGRQIAYDDLNGQANRLAHHLRAQGVLPGDCVGLCMERSLEFLIGVLAILKAGAAYLPLDPEYPRARLRMMVDDADARLTLTREPFAQSLPPSLTVVDFDCVDLACGNAENPRLPSSGEDLAYVMFTSGSTGKPKGVEILHRGISRLVINSDIVAFDSADVVAHCSNLSFDASTFEIWGALLNGARLVIFTNEELLSVGALHDLFAQRRITSLFLPTALFHQIGRRAPGCFGGIHHLTVGGEALDPDVVRVVLGDGNPPLDIINGYGPTEATTFAVCHHVGAVPDAATSIPIGHPISNSTAYVLDDDLGLVPVGSVGELHLGGPGLARGYAGASDLTACNFIETPLGRLYKTGDLARWRSDGTLEFVGRKDQQLKLRGYRIEPGEIEAAIRQAMPVHECKVLAREIVPGDRQLVAYFTRNGRTPFPPDVCRESLAQIVPEYMIPAAFVEVPVFPLTKNGKIAFDELPLPQVHEGVGVAGGAGPRNTLDAQLIAIWEELIPTRPIGIRDNFFDLGGHSLLAVRLLALIEERLGERLSFGDLYEGATIEALTAVLLDQQRAGASVTPLMAIHPSGTKQPLFFFHGDFAGGGFYCRNLAREIGADRPFYAVHPHGLDGNEPPRNIEDMVASRLAEIRSIQPHGPYHFGGYCNGALAAFETACQLSAAGEKVATLILLAINGRNVRYRMLRQISALVARWSGASDEVRRRRSTLWLHKARFGESLFAYYKAAAARVLREPWKDAVNRVVRKTRHVFRHRESNVEVPSEDRSARHARIYMDAVMDYIPPRFPGKGFVLWPEQDPIPPCDVVGPDCGWARLCRETQMTIIPGDHHSCVVSKEFYPVVAAHMRAALEAGDAMALAPRSL